MRWGLVVLSSAGLCSFTPMFHWHCEIGVEGWTHKNRQRQMVRKEMREDDAELKKKSNQNRHQEDVWESLSQNMFDQP